MPKEIFKDGKLVIELDINDPKDKLILLVKQSKGKVLTDKNKLDLFNAYAGADIIKI